MNQLMKSTYRVVTTDLFKLMRVTDSALLNHYLAMEIRQ